MKDPRPLLELSWQMEHALLYVYLGLPVKQRSVKALCDRDLVRELVRERRRGGERVYPWRLTHAGLAYLSAHVRDLRVSPLVLDDDRRKYHKLGFRHMKHPPHLATQPNNPTKETTP